MIFNNAQNSFSGGQLSARALGRENIDRYKESYKNGLNFIVEALGGVTRRGGTQYVAAKKSIAGLPKLLAFKYSSSDQYILEIGIGYIRFFKNRAPVMYESSVYEITNSYSVGTDMTVLRGIQNGRDMILLHSNYLPNLLHYTNITSWSVTVTGIVFTEAPSYWGTGNYPTVGWFFDDRLYLGGCPENPDEFAASKVGDHYDFGLGTGTATDGFRFKLNVEGEANKINWVVADNVIALGTAGAEYIIAPVDTNSAIAVDNIRAKRYTSVGSLDTPALGIDSTALFIQSSGTKLRRFYYVFENDRYKSEDLFILCPDLALKGLSGLSSVDVPDSIIWIRTSDGKLVGFTYVPDQKVFALHGHEIAGNGEVCDIASIQGTGNTDYVSAELWSILGGEEDSTAIGDGVPHHPPDELWMIVHRTINGSDAWYIEVMDIGLRDDMNFKAAYHVDSGVKANSDVPTKTVSGLDHLEGESVIAYTDGYVQGPFTVSGGAVSLTYSAKVKTVGLDFDSYMDILPAQVPSQHGAISFEKKQTSKLFARLHRTSGIKVGTDPNKMVEKIISAPSYLDTAIPPYTGLLELGVKPKNDRDIPIRISSSGPRPLTLLSLYTPMDVGV